MNRTAEIEAARLHKAPHKKALEPYIFCNASLTALETCREKVDGFEKWSALHEELLESVNKFGASCDADPNGLFWFSLPSVAKITDMHFVLRHFALKGWRRSNPPVLPKNDRTLIVYFLEHPDHVKALLEIRSYIRTGPDKDVCHLVEIGKRTIPIYELRCPDGNLNEEGVVT